MLALIVFVILILLLLYEENKDIIRKYFYLFNMPSPKGIPVYGHIMEVLGDEGSVFKKLRQWSKDHGPLFMLHVFHVVVANISGPDEFERLSTSPKHSQKADIYRFMHNWLGSGLLTSAGSLWQNRRKILTPAFHFSILKGFVSIFNEETDKLVRILKENVDEPVNVVPLISQCTLGAIVETAMGCKLNLHKESDNNYVQAIHKIGKMPFYRLIRPWTRNDTIFHNCFEQGKLETQLLEKIDRFTTKIIKNRQETFEKIVELPTDESEESEEKNIYFGKKKLVMLDVLLNAKFTNGSIDDVGIKDEVNTIMFEGHDTTATAISFTLMLLANNRKIQDLVYEEIKQHQPTDQSHLDWKELNNLKYMECVIKESLRLYPSVPVIGRIAGENIRNFDDYIIPKGAETLVHIYDIHRNPKFWQEPEKFDPDRFLPENCIDRHPFAYVPFSAGPRNCIGQKFAMIEMKAVLCGILKNFILEPVDTPDTIVLVPDIVLRTHDGSLLVKFVNRI